MSPETSAASESVLKTSVSETTVSETETETETEIPETSETVQEETESTENFDKVKDRVIFEDGENTLTAGQYIDALLQCSDFTKLYKNEIQLADINGDGIPEVKTQVDAYPLSIFFSVSADGTASVIQSEEKYNDNENMVNIENCKPYLKDSKTVWIGRFGDGGSGGGGNGNCILKYEDGIIKKEIIRCCDYAKNYDTFGYDYTYYWGSDGYWDDTKGEEVSEEEYVSRYGAFLAEMQPSETACAADHRYGGTIFAEQELPEVLANIMKEYLGV